MDDLIDQLRDGFPHRKFIDCLGCSNSHSDEENVLHCMVYEKAVAEDEACRNFN
ncbi:MULTISPECIES: hypothetical protein [Paenibacillus]|uniref:hypothetical protein n=1 Tax=Paenibacillus TaxID=44249 RepID=UPI0015C36F1C|nr:hypothetical protein [Paenibacillus odorifer]